MIQYNKIPVKQALYVYNVHICKSHHIQPDEIVFYDNVPDEYI